MVTGRIKSPKTEPAYRGGTLSRSSTGLPGQAKYDLMLEILPRKEVIGGNCLEGFPTDSRNEECSWSLLVVQEL
jgi:hypothetical protein